MVVSCDVETSRARPFAGMLPRALRQDQDKKEYGSRQNRGCERSAEGEATMIERLVEEITDGSAQRARQDESRPEKKYPACVRQIVEHREHREQTREYARRTDIAKVPGIGRPVAERRTERLRESNRDPLEQLSLRRAHCVDRDRTECPIPEYKRA